MINNDLKTLLEAVEDEDSFIRFVDALAANWALEQTQEKQVSSSPFGPGAQGWENQSIGSFLEAASAWAQVADHKIWGYTKADNPWRRVADILMAGKHYE